jgi:GT2 family glycosyltransferase
MEVWTSSKNIHLDLAYWISEKDSGQADAINKGMRRAKGEIVAWLNSDDYYLPGAIKSAVAAFESNPQAVMVYGNMLAVDQTGQTINQLHYRQLTLEDLLCFQIIGQPAVFMRRAAFEKPAGLTSTFILCSITNSGSSLPRKANRSH